MATNKQKKDNLEAFVLNSFGIDLAKNKSVANMLKDARIIAKDNGYGDEQAESMLIRAVAGELEKAEPPIPAPDTDGDQEKDNAVVPAKTVSFSEATKEVLQHAGVLTARRAEWPAGQSIRGSEIRILLVRNNAPIVEYIPSKEDRSAKDWEIIG